MNLLHQTDLFDKWLRALKDVRAKARIAVRLNAAKLGNFGDCRSVGEGVWEMRVHYGPGYRIYYAQEGISIYLLLVGGDKSSQTKDIVKAKKIWNKWRECKND